jgi:peptidoglycan/xylan/chitin deacetylase (PgdA/CDA1 family)
LDLPRTITSGVGGVVLTFDDGPHPEGTPAVLDTLARAGARATFFVVGEQVQRRPALVAEIAAAGHTVAVHGYRHRLQLRLVAGEVQADIERGVESIREAVGIEVAWHRPPYGIYSPAGLKFVREAGLRPLLWSRWGKDWRKFTTPSRIAARATSKIGSGDVILLHDADFYSSKGSHRRTVQALKTILSRLSHDGLDTVLPD